MQRLHGRGCLHDGQRSQAGAAMVATSLKCEESCGRWYPRHQPGRNYERQQHQQHGQNRFERRTLHGTAVVGTDPAAVQLMFPRLSRWKKTPTLVSVWPNRVPNAAERNLWPRSVQELFRTPGSFQMKDFVLSEDQAMWWRHM